MQGLAQDGLIPVLEAAFDAYAPPDRLVRIERLELDLGRIAGDALDPDRLRQAIARQLRGRWQSATAEDIAVPRAASLVEALITFLETGTWPWDAPCDTLAEAEAALRSLGPEEARLAARQLLGAAAVPASRRRLAYQFGADLAGWLVRQVYGEIADHLVRAGGSAAAELPPLKFAETLLAVASALGGEGDASPEQWRRLWVAALEQPADEQLPAPAPGGAAGGEPPARPGREEKAPRPSRASGRKSDMAGESLYVDLAGIVLLHPFLAQFFARLDLLDERGQFASFTARVRAVHLLYHLATGQEDPPEPTTALLKVLCGMPVAQPVPRELPLSHRERDEAESLLRAAIGHWAKLRNTSPMGLRETFLQRGGRLTREGTGWRLAVEQRPVDVLLGYLPWGLSVIRWPWVDAPLFVDWA